MDQQQKQKRSTSFARRKKQGKKRTAYIGIAALSTNQTTTAWKAKVPHF